MIFLGPCLIPILFAFAQWDNAHNLYQQGYDKGIFTTCQIIILICPYTDTHAFCFGYDAALRFEISDQ